MRVRPAGLLALVVLMAGVGVAAWQAQAPRTRRGPEPKVDLDPPAELIGEALRQARSDATPKGTRDSSAAAAKGRWVSEVKGFDYADLSPARREMFVRFANAQRCTCGCGYTLAGCRAFDPTCPVSGPRVTALLDSVRAGRFPGVSGTRRGPARSG